MGENFDKEKNALTRNGFGGLKKCWKEKKEKNEESIVKEDIKVSAREKE